MGKRRWNQNMTQEEYIQSVIDDLSPEDIDRILHFDYRPMRGVRPNHSAIIHKRLLERKNR